MTNGAFNDASRYWWENLKMKIILGGVLLSIVVIIIVIVVVEVKKSDGSSSEPQPTGQALTREAN
jgi:hypothetical protein